MINYETVLLTMLQLRRLKLSVGTECNYWPTECSI